MAKQVRMKVGDGDQVLALDYDSAQDYIIGGDDVGRLRAIVDHLKADWPEMADTLSEVLSNLVEV